MPIDTLRLYSSDYEIKNGAAITIQPGQLDYASGEVREAPLFRKQSGQDVLGASAFIQDDPRYHFQVQLKGGRAFAFIQASLPKVAHGDNYYPASQQESREALELIEGELSERGVNVDLKAAKISRLDLFCNACTSEPFDTYKPVYELLEAKRQVRRDYGSTYLWSNTRRELCVYNKNYEMLARGKDPKGLPDTTRFELRFKTAAVSREMLGFSTAGELLNNLDHAEEVYNDQLIKNLFRLVPGEVSVLAASQLEREMRLFKDSGGARWLSSYQKALGAERILLYGEAAIKRSLEDLGSNRMQSWRLLSQVKRDHAKLELLRTREGEVKSLADLYSELKQLVLGV